MNRKKNPDYLKYSQLDPEDDIVFFGPITLRELKKSIEVEEKIVKRRLEERKTKKGTEGMRLENKENRDEDALDRTFEIMEEQLQDPCNPHETLRDVTQFHQNLDETKLIELSVQFSNTFMKPPKPVVAAKKAICLLDETINVNESMRVHLQTPLFDKVCRTNIPESGSPLKENIEDSSVTTSRFVKLSDTFITDMASNVLVNTTITEEAEIESDVKRVSTPDIFKKKQNEIWKESSGLRRSAFKSKLPKVRKTPIKEKCSSYLFTQSPAVKEKNNGQLFAKSPAVTEKKNVHVLAKSPAVKEKNNTLLFAKSPAPKEKNNIHLLAKSPAMKELSNSYLFAKSPIAEYIHRGVGVQSMSKARHSQCVQNNGEIRSKSDSKNYPGKTISQCKIPVPTQGHVKRKLNLGDLGSRLPLFNNPKD